MPHHHVENAQNDNESDHSSRRVIINPELHLVLPSIFNMFDHGVIYMGASR